MPEQKAPQEKPKAEDKGAEGTTVKEAMFSKKGLMIMLVALLVEGVVAAALFSAMSKGTAGEAEQERKIGLTRINREYIEIDGPVVPVRKGVGGHATCSVKTIHIVIDPSLSAEDREILEYNIDKMKILIKQRLTDYLKQEGYERLMQGSNTRQVMQNRLREDIIRLLGVTEREIRDVELDEPIF